MTKIDMARQLIVAMPSAPARTLARRLVADYPEVFKSIDAARDVVRRALGVHGASGRGDTGKKELFRDARPAGWKPELPESDAEPWKPIILPTPCVALSLSDLHIPYHDKRAIETAVAYAKKNHRITDLILNGDFGDYYQASRFQRNPAKRSLVGELKDQRQGLEWLKDMFRRQRRWFKRGNHDERWDHWIWNHAPELADLEHLQLRTVLGLDKLGFGEVKDEPIMAGFLPILHGHETGKGSIAPPVNPARGAMMRTKHSILVGHSHVTSSHGESNMFHKERMAWSQGCLCDLTPEYARINNWNQGFAVIEVAKDGTYNLFNYRIGGDYAVRQS